MKEILLLGTDKTIYEKMVGVWSIIKVPNLQAALIGGEVVFTWTKGELFKLAFQSFDELAPIEIVNLIEKAMLMEHGIPKGHYRADLSGYSHDPFLSQN